MEAYVRWAVRPDAEQKKSSRTAVTKRDVSRLDWYQGKANRRFAQHPQVRRIPAVKKFHPAQIMVLLASVVVLAVPTAAQAGGWGGGYGTVPSGHQTGGYGGKQHGGGGWGGNHHQQQPGGYGQGWPQSQGYPQQPKPHYPKPSHCQPHQPCYDQYPSYPTDHYQQMPSYPQHYPQEYPANFPAPCHSQPGYPSTGGYGGYGGHGGHGGYGGSQGGYGGNGGWMGKSMPNGSPSWFH